MAPWTAPRRKHGCASKFASGKADSRPASCAASLLAAGPRVRTVLAPADSRQAYRWSTDRGRSRVIIKF